MNYALKILLREPYNLITSKAGRAFLRYCFIYGGKKRFIRFGTHLFKKSILIADNMSFLWQFHDIFVKEVYKFKTESKQPIIIDCGSNIGLSVIYFKKHYPAAKVVAFEADPDIFKLQVENLKHLEHVDPRNEAVWIDNKGIKLFRNKADGAFVSDAGDVQVSSIRLKDFLKTFDQIDLLKLDVEGAEFDLIRDCKDELSRVDKLFVEIHTFSGQQQCMAELLTTIESAGFRYFIENANYQNSPLTGFWKSSDTGMDMQLNLYAIRE